MMVLPAVSNTVQMKHSTITVGKFASFPYAGDSPVQCRRSCRNSKLSHMGRSSTRRSAITAFCLFV